MEAKFSNKVKEVISYSREEALRLGHEYIGTEHLLLGLLRDGEGLAINLLKDNRVEFNDLRNIIEETIRDSATFNKAINPNNIPLTRQAERVLKLTYLEAKLFRADIISTEHLLLSILKENDNIASLFL